MRRISFRFGLVVVVLLGWVGMGTSWAQTGPTPMCTSTTTATTAAPTTTTTSGCVDYASGVSNAWFDIVAVFGLGVIGGLLVVR